MEAGEENSGNTNLKRQREPLSDSEDNVILPSEVNDGQKRRRLVAAGQENSRPKPSFSGHLAERETKQDTQIVPSVRSRVQQLTQGQDGGAPQAVGPRIRKATLDQSVIIQKDFKGHLLTEGEFNQRMERFKVPVFQARPAPAPSSSIPYPRTCSNFVYGIQQKLQGTKTSSAKEASRIRQEREQELNLLQLQPISENAWLKRTSSDPSLTQQADGDVEMKDGSFTESLRAEQHSSDGTDAEVNSHDETNTAEIINQMFEEVLEYAGRVDDDAEGHDSGIGTCSGDKEKTDTESEKEKSEEEGEVKEECDESKMLESNEDELLTFPPSGILSPLSKCVEAVVTPLQLAVSQESNPPSLLFSPEETSTSPAESAPLYSIDAYRTQRQSKQPTIQSVTPEVQRRAPERSEPQPSVNAKEEIMALNEEAGKLQTVISQTLQALSFCTDEEHGRGSQEEAEAEKLLLVSCKKRSALLAEVARLRAERNYVSQQPCRGTVSITNIQLPLKVEFVCSSRNHTGRPSHYFFVLICYRPCNIVATPLATTADAQNGDTISFSTSVTLKDIHSSFEIDVEVYCLSHNSGSNCSMDLTATKSWRSNSLTSAALSALNTRRSSNFCLVGSHKITLASLGHSKFPLDKVPFLSPLEGNIYLRLDSQSHSNVQHQGFLTMFELISGHGVWHRRYFVLEGCNMHYWNYPNDKETKEAEGSISLSSSSRQCVRPVKRDLCARPFTFELVSNISQHQQDDSQEALAKCWFSADTKQERIDWIEKLSQVLLDFHTWNRTPATQTESQQSNTSSSVNLRESIL